MTSNRRIALVTTIALAIIAVTWIAGHKWYESTLPPLTNAQLARAIEHDEAGGGFMEGSLAHVSCRTLARPARSGATRECVERSIGNICIDPSTPTVYQLEIVVRGRHYRELARSTLVAGECSVF
jgi:hypothetical protein